MLNKNGKANLGLLVLMLLACTFGSGTFGLHAQTGLSADKVEPASAFAPTGYRILGRYPISGDGSWDYIALDSVARRLYVSHGAQVQVLDADSGKIVGQIADTPEYMEWLWHRSYIVGSRATVATRASQCLILIN